jgi:hypothetical protein
MQKDRIEFWVKSGWGAGLFYLLTNLTLTVIYASGGSLADVFWFNWVDMAIVALLTFGVYRRSRASAVGLFAYFVITNVVSFLQYNQIISLPAVAIIGILLFLGIRGTFAHHAQGVAQTQTA